MPFQPLFPQARALGPLLELAAQLVAEGHRLESAAGALRAALGPLLRAMNSYYTNKIEGQHTRPADIELALTKHFARDAKQAQKQRLALAHIEAEKELEATLPERGSLYDMAFVKRVHEALYTKLPISDRITEDGKAIVPGEFRSGHVTAGMHLAPASDQIENLLEVWRAQYMRLPGVEQAIVGVACSHHRLLWIHPFIDGNGRTARLHTHLVLSALGVTQGLWSPLRGMARQHESYYARLHNADLPRRNDLDGRGALSEEELVAFTRWLVEICIDQASFMRGLLNLEQFKERIGDLLLWLDAHPWQVGTEKSVVKVQALEPLHYVALSGELERSRFLAMTGLPQRTARRVLASLLDFGVLTSTGHRDPVAFAIPFQSLRFLFPRLWPEAEADVD